MMLLIGVWRGESVLAGIGEEQDAGGGKGRVSKAENETAASRIWLGNFIQTAPPFLPAGGWPYEAYTTLAHTVESAC